MFFKILLLVGLAFVAVKGTVSGDYFGKHHLSATFEGQNKGKASNAHKQQMSMNHGPVKIEFITSGNPPKWDVAGATEGGYHIRTCSGGDYGEGTCYYWTTQGTADDDWDYIYLKDSVEDTRFSFTPNGDGTYKIDVIGGGKFNHLNYHDGYVIRDDSEDTKWTIAPAPGK